MMAMRTRSDNSDPRQTISTILWFAAVALCLGMSHATAAAQTQGRPATVRRAAPGAVLYGGGVTPSALRQGDTLQPRDVIDTRGSGRVVIALGDGSQVTIFPGSLVELKNFQAGGSWRDLLKVTVGRVRATINHYGKRPNPYRVYSPVASIAVRGTDFSVTVELSGETRVLVYEGLVEVGSLVNPQKTVLVRPGRNIIVRPGGDISLVTAAPRGELNEIRSLGAGMGQEFGLRAAYDSHGDSYTGLRSSRFTAFNDSYLDSLQNPAYATEFRRPGGRFYLVPSFSPEYGASSSNYTLSPQASYFMPLGSKIVVGAGMAVTKTDIGGAQAESYINLPNQAAGYRSFDGNVKFTTTNLSLVAARRFGQAGRTSFGVKFDYLIDRSLYSFNKDTSESRNPQPDLEEGEARGRRAGLSVGVTQDIGDDKKLGVYYRYSMGSVENSYKRSGFWGFINDDPYFYPAAENSRTRPGHSSEAGVLFRGSATRRLFYGVESSILFERDQEEDHIPHPPIIPGDASSTPTEIYLNKRRVRQGMIGVGIGYAVRKGAILSLDISTGRAREDSLGRSHYSNVPPGARLGSTGIHAHERASFRTWHIGGQTDVWRNLFASGSLFYISERKRSDWGFFVPEEYLDVLGGDYPSYEESSNGKYKLLTLSAGWRLTPGWIAQYVYSQYVYSFGYGLNAPSHTLMFRYEFGRREEK
jgi:hypothetical protein